MHDSDYMTMNNDPSINHSSVYLSSSFPGFGSGGHLSPWDGLMWVGGLVIDVSPDARRCLTLQAEHQEFQLSSQRKTTLQQQ